MRPSPAVAHPLLLDEPVLLPELLLDTTEMALAMASTADRRSANVFLSERSASGRQADLNIEPQTCWLWGGGGGRRSSDIRALDKIAFVSLLKLQKRDR